MCATQGNASMVADFNQLQSHVDSRPDLTLTVSTRVASDQVPATACSDSRGFNLLTNSPPTSSYSTSASRNSQCQVSRRSRPSTQLPTFNLALLHTFQLQLSTFNPAVLQPKPTFLYKLIHLNSYPPWVLSLGLYATICHIDIFCGREGIFNEGAWERDIYLCFMYL